MWYPVCWTAEIRRLKEAQTAYWRSQDSFKAAPYYIPAGRDESPGPPPPRGLGSQAGSCWLEKEGLTVGELKTGWEWGGGLLKPPTHRFAHLSDHQSNKLRSEPKATAVRR